ncbi:hypothetical protein [Massilia timonae]|uniref:hypothetical protein n=1 Tax=Massilia timonae TaxID=47229 RepID=UPI0028D6AE23|nr:hypothetical protein [Massilia timonae]
MLVNRYTLAGVAVALAAVLILVKKNGIAGAGVVVGEAAAEAVGGAIAGGAHGIGDWFGIPRTDETECDKAIREGRYWDASFACPAGKFIGAAADGVSGTISDWWN